MADVEMIDAASPPKTIESIEVDNPIKEEEGDNIGSDNEHNEAQEGGGDDRPVSNAQYKALKNITEVLTDFKIIRKKDEDYYPSTLFRRVPNKRNLPEYYDIIKEPAAISTLKGKIQRKQYTGIPEFVRDFALIVHNAQVFNRPNSAPVRDVLQLENVFKEEMHKLVDAGLVKKEETQFPDLGLIPAATPEPDPVSEEDEEDEGEEDGDEEEDEEDVEDSDDETRKRRGRKGRPSISGRKPGRDDDEDGGKGTEGDNRKRRGRPPKVDTPLDAKIKAVLKALRKSRSAVNELRIVNFEKLPDKTENPVYYLAIKDPIALDTIKKKAKRKKYRSLDDLMVDFELMFNNAMQYNEDDSDLYRDAKALLAEAKELVESEKKKPDDAYLMEDGRLPLPDGILYKSEMWKVGDWIHIENPNDVTKPIVAQIYRTWQGPDGQKWINACWYYHPEQTIHQYEKHFFPDEVVKTGQYRDHKIEEVIDRCFVMFVTRFSRGRPRNFDSKYKVYVCEARYNEEKHKFNKIKTWASCLPDEVRDKDYEMDLFAAPIKIKKKPSPLLYLLKDETKTFDEIPTPQRGSKDAPPIVGGIHKQSRDENQSPPPEPTPPPPSPPPPQPVRAPSTSLLPHQQPRHSMDRTASTNQTGPTQMTPQGHPYQAPSASPAPQYTRQPSYSQSGATVSYTNTTPQTPIQPQTTPYVAQQQLHPPPALSAAHPTNYANNSPSQSFNQPPLPQAPPPPAFPVYPAHFNEPRSHEAYVLDEAANQLIPQDIRDRFPQDDNGRVLFFTKPPVDTRHIVSGRSEGEKGKPLQHSEAYVKAKEARLKRIRELKTQVQARIESKKATENYTPPPPGYFSEERDENGITVADPARAKSVAAELAMPEQEQKEAKKKEHGDTLRKFVDIMCENMNQATITYYRDRYGDRALEFFDYDHNLTLRRMEREKEEDKRNAELQRRFNYEEKPVRLDQDFWTGRYPDGSGRFEDDYDNRLPPYN